VSGTAFYGAVSVGTTATRIWAGKSIGRSALVFNNGAATLYVGTDANVTTSTGIPVAAGSGESFSAYTGAVYGICASGTLDVRYQVE
jgi:hypothetical protein